MIKPSATNKAIKDFNSPHFVYKAPMPGAQLVVFMGGADGMSKGVQKLFEVVVNQGYSLIGLEYPNKPGVVAACRTNKDLTCSAALRQMRVYGTGPSKVASNKPESSIVGRLTSLLVKLAKDHPDEGWDSYLKDRAPDWSQIVLSGHSQGAGMSAFLAKATPVARVALFSGPTDFTDPGSKLANWIGEPSATPPERWFAAYNTHELAPELLEQSYQLLGVPKDNVRAFSLDLPKGVSKKGNAYHPMGAMDPRYTEDWKFLFGEAGD